MSFRVTRLFSTALALCLVSALLPVALAHGAQNEQANAPRGDISTSSSGRQATTAGALDRSPPGQEPPSEQGRGEAGAPDNGGQDLPPDLAAEMQPDSDVVKLCRTFNAGHAGIGDEPVKLCYAAPTVEEQAEDSGQSSAPSALAARAVAQLTVPEPVISLSPQPSDNKWNVLAVGLPLWFWSENPGPVTTSATADGIEIVMTATRGQVRFDWGDDTTTICSTMRQRTPNTHPLTPSPDCGHTYMQAGDYTITATAGWAVTWHALGQTGTIPLTTTATTDVPIREFAAVVVG